MKGLAANSLDLNDMSGNVNEWCFAKISNATILMGGHYFSDMSDIYIGYRPADLVNSSNKFRGFRIARTE
ncbi:MAG: SUMF1/EgtB/PvdO family nonheme iron enzyme [Spirochaetes bacterium]|nr:SUMF1/EgtB/PvdO family nonheme iron enzyme [Spirochaetota bacterium]